MITLFENVKTHPPFTLLNKKEGDRIESHAQIAYYPMYDIPERTLFKMGSYFMNTLFVLFAVVNTMLVIYNVIGFYRL